MQRWEYMTLVVRIGREKFIEITQINGKDAKAIEEGSLFKEPLYPDLPSFLSEAGREGWEVCASATLTSTIPSSGFGEGRDKVMVILKRPVA